MPITRPFSPVGVQTDSEGRLVGFYDNLDDVPTPLLHAAMALWRLSDVPLFEKLAPLEPQEPLWAQYGQPTQGDWHDTLPQGETFRCVECLDHWDAYYHCTADPCLCLRCCRHATCAALYQQDYAT